MKRPQGSIHLIPLGEVSDDYLRILAENIEEQFGLPVTITPNLAPPLYALDPVRQQYNSNMILKRLLEEASPDAIKILGITDVDLFNPIFSFVFGEAQFKGKCAVVSSYRLRGNPDHGLPPGCPPLLNRLEKEAIHELGHTFGLRHCSDPDCVMKYSVGLACADRKFSFFCPACRELVLWHFQAGLSVQVKGNAP
ncbi:MAG TPA: archaemetzincin family Zn-dependent metalloprotease [Syntrophobacteria bacterium]|nr:archaemetzincin family Zn-dependent metalloprotease [Syntrophobacteria bacterium]